MILTVFCAVMLTAFIGCLIATKSAYVLFGAVLLLFLLTGLLRRPIRYRENRWIFVFYRLTLRVVPATAQITGNPNEVVLYQLDRKREDSFIGVNAGAAQVVSGMSLYPYKGRRLLVLFPVPGFLQKAWQANLFFGGAAAAVLVFLASIGFVPYQRLRNTDALLSHTVHTELLHSESADVIDDPVLDNVLLVCRDPENGAELLELFCFRHSSAEVMPLYVNQGLLTETSAGTYGTLSEYAKTHTLAELVQLTEESISLHISDAVCLDYGWLCAAAGSIPVTMTQEEIIATNRVLSAECPDTPLLSGSARQGESVQVICDWEQARAFLRCEDAGGAKRAMRQAAVTDGLLSLLTGIMKGDAALPAGDAAQTSFTAERLYRLSESVRSDSTHYRGAYEAWMAEDAIGRLCIPRESDSRGLAGGTVYAPPGVIRQYMIRLIYY